MDAPNLELTQLKSHPDVLRLYKERLPDLKQEGNNYVALCPFHEERTPSFKIRKKDGQLLWYCFGCRIGGSIICFFEKFYKIDTAAAIDRVRKELDDGRWKELTSKVDDIFKPVCNKKEEFKVFSLDEYAPLEKALQNSTEAQEWLKNQRGITYETAKALHLGFRKSVKAVTRSVDEELVDAGWIVLPAIKDDKVVSIKYRSIKEKAFVRQVKMATEIFNLQAVDPFLPIYVTEGEFDAAVLVQAGFAACSLPSAGFKLSPEMRDQLKEAYEIFLAGDNDATGINYMDKLWAELGERTYKLVWPDSMKDANQTFLEYCKGDIASFRKLVIELTNVSRSKPLPHVISLVESMEHATRVNLSDNPQRFRFPWDTVDKMAILLPGSVVSVFATNTKMGKTQWMMNATLYAAKQGHVVLNYQCELSPDEFSNLVVAHVCQKNRNHIEPEDYKAAAKELKSVRYYIGRDQTLNTVTPVLDLIELAIRRLGITVVVLDHIHFICRNEKDEVQAQANAMQRIKLMAQQYGVIFFVVAQPRKSDKANRGKMVHVTDLKGSEAVASDADAIFALHRDWIKNKDENNPPMDDYEPVTEVHLLGARAKGDGPTFTKLVFKGEKASFKPFTTEEPPPDLG